ncbi:MAG: aldehyde dehydrogenase [Pseudomonadota bacterium]
MTDVLTQSEYEGIAASLTLPTGAFINGSARRAASGRTFESLNPATGDTLSQLALCEAADVDLAVEKARDAFNSGSWAHQHPADRKATLIKLVKLIKRHQHELAVLESLESGKPIYDIETVDLPETLHCLEWHAEAADKIYDQVAPAGNDAVAMIVREPLGVVGAVLPWNFPLLMLAWKMAPALAAGNSLIVKPAEETSMTALRVAELAIEAGLPRGVFNVITGPGEITGQLLGLHHDVDMVSFTGSTEIGRRFLEYSAQSNLKKIVLECGGKNPCVVMDDVENLDMAAQHATNAAFWNMGENCSANSRLVAHKEIATKLVTHIENHLKQWPLGNPLDPVNRLGAIVSKQQHARIMGYIEQAKSEGATLVTGGESIEVANGFFIAPTIFTGVTPSMTLAKEEVFGPVLAVIEIASEEEAINVANDTCYGLAASVFTASVRRAHRMAKAIRAGTVTVNTYGEGDISTPFGGFKQSGFGGRDNSLHAHDQFTELKTIWIDLADSSQDALD